MKKQLQFGLVEQWFAGAIAILMLVLFGLILLGIIEVAGNVLAGLLLAIGLFVLIVVFPIVMGCIVLDVGRIRGWWK